MLSEGNNSKAQIASKPRRRETNAFIGVDVRAVLYGVN